MEHQVVAEITCDGVKNNVQCFDAIEGDVTAFLNEHGRDKFVNMTLVWVTPAGVIDTYYPLGCSSTYYSFIRPAEISGGNTLYTYTAIIGVGSTSSAFNSSTTTTSGTTFANRATAVPANGAKLRVVYN